MEIFTYRIREYELFVKIMAYAAGNKFLFLEAISKECRIVK